MKNCLPLILLFCFAFFSLNAQVKIDIKDIPYAKENEFIIPDHQKNSSTDTVLTELLNATFDSLANSSSIYGFSAAFLFPDGTEWESASGLAQTLPDTVALTSDHLLAMGSISKTFVSATILKLVEEGLLSLDDTIGQYMGPFPNIPDHVDIRQLLGHRSGINDYLNENPATTADWSLNLDSIWVIDTVLNHYVLEPNFAPGTSWSYSNTNFLLAGLLIEKITNQPWYEVVREKIIDPLELSNTFVYPWEMPEEQTLANVFLDLDGNGTIEDVQGSGFALEGLFSLASSAGCLISKPSDLNKFTTQLFSGQVLQAGSLDEMMSDNINNPFGTLMYGLGAAQFFLNPHIENWGHNGSLLYQSFALYFPDKGFSLAIQQNDPRLDSPQMPVLDIYGIFLELLATYLDYCENLVSSSDLDQQSSLIIFPNPASEQINIDLGYFEGNEIHFTLINSTGQVVNVYNIKNTLDSQITLDLPQQLNSGTYFLHIKSDQDQTLKKLQILK